jgi:hypothetical protein
MLLNLLKNFKFKNSQNYVGPGNKVIPKTGQCNIAEFQMNAVPIGVIQVDWISVPQDQSNHMLSDEGNQLLVYPTFIHDKQSVSLTEGRRHFLNSVFKLMAKSLHFNLHTCLHIYGGS